MFSQANLEPGTLITDTGESLEGYIDFKDWSRNPTKVSFTTDSTQQPKTYRVWDVQEFTVMGQKYISRYVKIDETPFKVPVVKVIPRKSRKDRVFLKVLVEGDLSLYQYRELRSNFFIEENGKITALISHEFVVKQRGRFVFVDTFKDEYIRQLKRTETDCRNISKKNLDYEAESLAKYVSRCNLPPGEELSDTFRVPGLKQKGSFRISPFVATASYRIGYFRTRTTRVEITDLNGNPELVDVESRSVEEVSTFALTFGADIMYYLPGDLSTRAILLSFAYTPRVFEEDELYPEMTMLQISAGYRYKFRNAGIQPYLEGAISVFRRNSAYYDEEIQEAFIPGFRIGLGIEYGKFWTALKADIHNRRSSDLQHNGISLSMGIQL